MFRGWDSDRKLLVILLVAALMSLAVSYKGVLADKAGQLAQKVERTLGKLNSKTPTASTELSGNLAPRRAFTSHSRHACRSRCGQSAQARWYGVVDCEGRIQVIGRCSGDGW
jgi:hypothetical protein